ncbi:hypothetical protein MTP99_016710 [Tenebrio molitor]|nr:hypothetical protein MTP99_016710 [Tenebrio molitor]
MSGCTIAVNQITSKIGRRDSFPATACLARLSFYRFSESNVQGSQSEERKGSLFAASLSITQSASSRRFTMGPEISSSHELAGLDLLWRNRQHTRDSDDHPRTVQLTKRPLRKKANKGKT